MSWREKLAWFVLGALAMLSVQKVLRWLWSSSRRDYGVRPSSEDAWPFR
jgi:hypothetical protein